MLFQNPYTIRHMILKLLGCLKNIGKLTVHRFLKIHANAPTIPATDNTMGHRVQISLMPSFVSCIASCIACLHKYNLVSNAYNMK